MQIRWILSGMVLALAIGWGAPALATELVDELTQQYEEFLLGRLALAQQPPARLAPFSTDGCSGGLSEGWRLLAEFLPQFRQQYGTKPPWEHCCVKHDWLYWRGETKDGFEKRKQADAELKQCVIETGQNMKSRLAAKYETSEARIMERFSLSAEWIYAAVRVGGLPCSPFPWRWGYGWPQCPVFEPEQNQLNKNWSHAGSEVE